MNIEPLESRIAPSGYATNLAPVNSNAGIGAVKIGGGFAASNIVAGLKDTNGDGFGNNDDTFASAPAFARIVSVRIGVIAGTPETTLDHYGIVAKSIGPISVHGTSLPLPTPGTLFFSPTTLSDIVIRSCGI